MEEEHVVDLPQPKEAPQTNAIDDVETPIRRSAAPTDTPISIRPTQTKRKQQPKKRRRRRPKIKHSCINYIAPSFVTFMALFGYTIGLLGFLPKTLSNPLARLFHFCLGTFVVSSMLYSLWMSVNTSPGIVSETWDASLRSEEKDRLMSIELNERGGRRYCAHCGMDKPPRAHHSGALNKCVKRMDHYCIWVNNVIGYENHKYFILFLVYTVIGISHFLCAAMYTLFVESLTNFESANPLYLILVFVFSVFTLPMVILVTIFLAWNIYLLFTNQTSIEYHNNSGIMESLSSWRRSKRGKQLAIKTTYEHAYDTNWYENICSIMGSSPLIWFIPFGSFGTAHLKLSDGINYPTKNHERIEAINSLIISARAFPHDDDMFDVLTDSDDEYAQYTSYTAV